MQVEYRVVYCGFSIFIISLLFLNPYAMSLEMDGHDISALIISTWM